MGHEDFLNIFTGVYIASKRDKHDYYSQYYLLDIPPTQTDAVYLEFFIEKEGFLDFVIKQFENNKVPYSTERSRVEHAKEKK